MVTEKMYNDGINCRGICQYCNEDINNCYQYLTDIKGTKYDFSNIEENNTNNKIYGEHMDRPNLFIKMSNKDLKECYRSYCRIQCKRENEVEILNPIISEYKNYVGEKASVAVASSHMFNEITRRFIKIIDSIGDFKDIIEMNAVDEYLTKKQ